MESEIIVGLDIGTTKIVAMVGRRNEHGKIEILGYGKTASIGVMRGVVANIDRTVQSIRKAVEDAENNSGVEIKLVNVGIAGQHIKSIQHNGLLMRKSYDIEITQEDVDTLTQDMCKLVMPPGEEIIHALPQEYNIDHEKGIKDPIGMCGIRMEANFHIITGQIAAAKNIYKCVDRAGLETESLILEPLASAEAVLSPEEKEAGVALVDIGGGTTDIAIFQDGIIRHTAVIALGGDIITEDIKEGCTIIKDQAEMLKVRFGSALATESKNEVVSIPGLKSKAPKEISVRTLANIIQSRMEDIIEHVYYEIKNSGYEKKLIAGIVITGGGSKLKHVTQLMEYMTGIETRIGFPNEHLAKGTDEIASPMYSTSIGLVIKGFERYDMLRSTKALTEDGTEKPEKPELPKAGGILTTFFEKTRKFFEEDNHKNT
jgi:cell division protein FtsA